MSMKRDDVLLLAVLFAVACPSTLPLVGNPTNWAAALLLCVPIFVPAAVARLRLSYLLALVVVLAALATVAGEFEVGGDLPLNPNAFGPFVRLAVCACAVACAVDPRAMHRKLLWIGTAASVFAIFQYVFPEVAEFTSRYYLGAERSTVFTEDFSGDSIVRVIGVYENPSSVALLAVVLILLSVHAYARHNIGRSTLALFLIVNLAAGVLSLSKIFFACLPLVMFQLVLLRFNKSGALAILVIALGAWLVFQVDDPLLELIRYSVNSALDPDAALKGRYLADQEQAVASSWLFGHGVVAVGGVNVNDSAYLVLGFLVGGFGIAVLALHLVYWIWRAKRSVPATFWLVLAALLIAGVGANSVLGFRVDILTTALVVSLCSPWRLLPRSRLAAC
jgi:hypothetical protein